MSMLWMNKNVKNTFEENSRINFDLICRNFGNTPSKTVSTRKNLDDVDLEFDPRKKDWWRDGTKGIKIDIFSEMKEI